ncbi:salicylate hydroxylase [Angomonas deanei]|nr:salicylate hydroxylase [Angomonas deanei]|eukprot:EPY28975.1 salicylate hydroxylase [Angomonas deanei]
MNLEKYFGIKNSDLKWLLKIRNGNIRLQSLGEEDIIPISTAPLANSESIVSRRLAEQQKTNMGYVPLRTTMSATYLRDALRRHVPEIKFGATVVDLVPHDGVKGGVHVMLDDGSSEWGDVVVGADGMHSVIRRLLYSGEHVGRSNRSLGAIQIDGFVDVNHNLSALEFPVELWGKEKTVSFVPHFKHGENRIAFSATIGKQADAVSSLHEEDTLSILRGVLKTQFQEFGSDICTLLGQATLAVPTDVLEVPVMPRWYNKRAVLMGDAAHGSLPSFLQQDASLCVEDAALLATALTDVPLLRDNGFEYAFKQYESVRRSRVEKYIRQSRRARSFALTPHTVARDVTTFLTPPFLFVPRSGGCPGGPTAPKR